METQKKKPRLKLWIRSLLYTLSLGAGLWMLYALVFTRVAALGSFAQSQTLAAVNGEPQSFYAPSASVQTLPSDSVIAKASNVSETSAGEAEPPQKSLSSNPEQENLKLSEPAPAEPEPEEQPEDSDPSLEESREPENPSEPGSTEEEDSEEPEPSVPESDPEDSSSKAPSREESESSSEQIVSETAAAEDLGYPILSGGAQYTILIDAGHGGNDTGDAARDGTMEKNITLKMAKAIQNHLEIQNPSLSVVLMREGDSLEGSSQETGWEDLIARRKKQEEIGADYFLSLHAHKDSGSAAGYSFILNPDDPLAASLGQAIEANLKEESWGSASGWTTTDQFPLQLISLASSHSLQLNLGLLSEESDLKRLCDEKSIEHGAAAIAAAISSTIQENPEAPAYVSRARQIEQQPY